jgi:hypothetical protein
MNILKSLLVSFAALGLAVSVHAATRPAVVELFTSEGCSSCPPAEKIINELAQRADVLPLSFHVDYWDGLGWRDPYSLASATARQRVYGHALHLSSIYTPQAVIDGSLDVVGSQRATLIRAVGTPREGIATSIVIVDGEIRIAVGADAGASRGDVFCVGYLRQATSHIGRGENSGRTLTESNIVRSLQLLGHWNGEAHEYRVKLDSLPPEVTDIAAIVQLDGQRAILGAAARPIR